MNIPSLPLENPKFVAICCFALGAYLLVVICTAIENRKFSPAESLGLLLVFPCVFPVFVFLLPLISFNLLRDIFTRKKPVSPTIYAVLAVWLLYTAAGITVYRMGLPGSAAEPVDVEDETVERVPEDIRSDVWTVVYDWNGMTRGSPTYIIFKGKTPWSGVLFTRDMKPCGKWLTVSNAVQWTYQGGLRATYSGTLENNATRITGTMASPDNHGTFTATRERRAK